MIMIEAQQQAMTEGERRAAIRAYRVVYWRNVFRMEHLDKLAQSYSTSQQIVPLIERFIELNKLNTFILQQIKDLQK